MVHNPTLKVPREWTLSVPDRAPKTGTKNDSTQAWVKESPSLIGGIYKTPGSHCKGNVRLPATIMLPQSFHLQNCSPSITISFWKNCDLENFTVFIFAWKTISNTSPSWNVREQWYLKAFTPYIHFLSIMRVHSCCWKWHLKPFPHFWTCGLSPLQVCMILRQMGINERLNISCTFMGHLPSRN